MSSIFLLTQKETDAELIELGKSIFGVTLHASAIQHLQQKSIDGVILPQKQYPNTI